MPQTIRNFTKEDVPPKIEDYEPMLKALSSVVFGTTMLVLLQVALGKDLQPAEIHRDCMVTALNSLEKSGYVLSPREAAIFQWETNNG